MKIMTWPEIDKDWAGLQKRHRAEIAEAVARYCIGHRIREVAKHLGYTQSWVQKQLDYAGVYAALGGTSGWVPLKTAKDDNVSHDMNRIVQTYAPTEKDEEQFQPYIEHYEKIYCKGDNLEEGKSVARRLAKAEWAAETAVEKGIIAESKGKRDEKVNRILFPDDDKDTFELRLRHHMAAVEAAARFLDTSKMPHLRRKSTCKKVALANAKWVEQVNRIRNQHPTFDEVC